MESGKVAAILAQYKDSIPEDQLLAFKAALEKADEGAYERLMTVPIKNATTTILLSVFLGGLGIDRFYIGDTGVGVAKLLLGGLTWGIWPLIDIFVCHNAAKEKNLQNLLAVL